MNLGKKRGQSAEGGHATFKKTFSHTLLGTSFADEGTTKSRMGRFCPCCLRYVTLTAFPLGRTPNGKTKQVAPAEEFMYNTQKLPRASNEVKGADVRISCIIKNDSVALALNEYYSAAKIQTGRKRSKDE
jgi:hypothetical protein